MHGKVESALKDGVGEIVFSSEKANSLNSELLSQLLAHIEKLGQNSLCKVLSLKSLGKTFCAGASFEEMKSLTDVASAEKFFSLFGLVTIALREVPQPVLVSVQGKAVGGGVGLLAAADYAVGTAEVAVKLSELSVGIGPFAISPVLEWKIGSARLMELTLSGEWRDASWCISTGLLSELTSDLPAACASLEKRFTTYPASVLAEMKSLTVTPGMKEQMLARAKKSAYALLSS
jgi:methylglutaconyl-CoA hydratase